MYFVYLYFSLIVSRTISVLPVIKQLLSSWRRQAGGNSQSGRQTRAWKEQDPGKGEGDSWLGRSHGEGSPAPQVLWPSSPYRMRVEGKSQNQLSSIRPVSQGSRVRKPILCLMDWPCVDQSSKFSPEICSAADLYRDSVLWPSVSDPTICLGLTRGSLHFQIWADAYTDPALQSDKNATRCD